MKFALENLRDCWDEVYAQAIEHNTESKHYHGAEFNPDKERYFDYNDRGFFFMFTARVDGKLVGNFGMYLMPSMHTQQLVATEDAWFLLPEYRKGRNAIRFYNFMEKEMIKRGAKEITVSSRIGNSVEKIINYLGYNKTNFNYSKLIQENQDV